MDVNFDLENDKYFPFKKPNDIPIYVHSSSNHPQNILKQIPVMTGKRLTNLSCNKEEFDKAAVEYQEVLKKSGFKEKLSYVPANQQNRRQRNRKILWYNPPFDLQVKSYVGKIFLQLLDKHFPYHHRLHKIINRNTVKVSYSCMPNVASHISSRNRNILKKSRKSENTPLRTCNCSTPELCPLEGNCMQPAVIYKADVKPDGDAEQHYIGLSEPNFKGRWADHRTSFTFSNYRNKSKLSAFVWDRKYKGQICDIKWSILRRSSPYRAGNDRCNLCLWEKFHIMKGENLINKRDELVSKCLHINKFLLRKFKDREKWQFFDLCLMGMFVIYYVVHSRLTNYTFIYFRFSTFTFIWWFQLGWNSE